MEIKFRTNPGTQGAEQVYDTFPANADVQYPHTYLIKYAIGTGNWSLWVWKPGFNQGLKLKVSRSEGVVKRYAGDHHEGEFEPTADEMAYAAQAIPAKKLGLIARPQAPSGFTGRKSKSKPRPHAKGYKGKFARGKR